MTLAELLEFITPSTYIHVQQHVRIFDPLNGAMLYSGERQNFEKSKDFDLYLTEEVFCLSVTTELPHAAIVIELNPLIQ